MLSHLIFQASIHLYVRVRSVWIDMFQCCLECGEPRLTFQPLMALCQWQSVWQFVCMSQEWPYYVCVCVWGMTLCMCVHQQEHTKMLQISMFCLVLSLTLRLHTSKRHGFKNTVLKSRLVKGCLIKLRKCSVIWSILSIRFEEMDTMQPTVQNLHSLWSVNCDEVR